MLDDDGSDGGGGGGEGDALMGTGGLRPNSARTSSMTRFNDICEFQREKSGWWTVIVAGSTHRCDTLCKRRMGGCCGNSGPNSLANSDENQQHTNTSTHTSRRRDEMTKFASCPTAILSPSQQNTTHGMGGNHF